MMESAAENIGGLLQAKREQLGHSIQDVAKYTCIRKVYLESIEAGRFEDLPGQAYVVGFVRVYARYLGLDSNVLLMQLDGSQPTEAPEESLAGDTCKAQTQSPEQPAAATGWGTFTLGFVAVLLFGALLYFLPPIFTTRTPAENAATVPVAVNHSAPPVVEETGAQTAKTAAQQVETVASPVITATTIAGAEKALPTISPQGSSLRMLALSESSLIIYVDDREPNQYQLYDGLDLSWQVKKTVRVELAEPGAAEFWLDGQKLALEKSGSFKLMPAAGG